jgi:transcriptional regulator with XRE-family HTH domain
MLFNRLALADFLQCKEVTRADLAKQTDLSPGYITDLLKGNKRNPTLDTIRRIASALNISAGSLYFELPAEVVEALSLTKASA